MSEQPTGSGTGHDPQGPSSAVRLDEGAGRALAARFENPGLPAHVHRAADDNPKAAKRAERQVVALFTLSILATLVFLVGYFSISYTDGLFVPFVGTTNKLNLVLGISLGVSLLGIGFGAVHWAKALMSDAEVVEERHAIGSDEQTRAKNAAIFADANESTQLGRRPLIKYSLGGALALFILPLGVQLAGSMGNPTKALEELQDTIWDVPPGGEPIRLMRDPEMTPIKASDVVVGSVFHVLPETIKDSEHVLEDKAKAAVIVMRLNPSDFADDALGQKGKSWGFEGIVAYSKICTHVGCPVALYEQQTHHLLCPCHQSTFDLTRDCAVIFGPAKRPLPQLKITVDDEDYLVAPQGFAEPVGPSYWERLK
ncbi:MAG: Rieske 2Fe-2S domain-containing protein [Dermatophilaceae bacterium]